MGDLTVLITGANGGLGALVLEKLAARDGTTVFAAARSLDKLKSVTDPLKLGQGAKLHPVELDVLSDDSMAKAVDTVKETLGDRALDVLIVNAGVQVDSVKRSDMVNTFEVNAVAPILVTEAFKPLLEASKRPTVINVSSDLGSIGWKLNESNKFRGYGNPSYGASKAALNRITAHYAVALPKFRVVSVNPSFSKTAFNHHSDMAQDPDLGATKIYETVLEEGGQSGVFISQEGPSAGKDLPW